MRRTPNSLIPQERTGFLSSQWQKSQSGGKHPLYL